MSERRFSLVFIGFLIFFLCVTETRSELCEEVKRVCMGRIGCGMALHTFMIGCTENLAEKMSYCTTGCKRALLSLLSAEDEEGLKFIQCDCHNGTHCQEQKERIEVCANDVLPVLDQMDDNTSVLSCTLAKWICEADSSCLEALQYYEALCGSMFRGYKCSSRCNNSVSILYGLDKAKKLRTCRCEGNEPFQCDQMRYYTDTLCLNKERPPLIESGQITHSISFIASVPVICNFLLSLSRLGIVHYFL